MTDLRIIKVFEDRQQKTTLNDQEIKDLLLIRNIIGENNLILQADGKLLVRHYVGFVQVNQTRLLIYPKVSLALPDESSFGQAFDILVRMLIFSGFEQVKKINSPQMLERYNGDILELFIGVFVEELLALFKRDVNRGYRRNIENQTFITGKIDFTENIKENSYRKHLHAVRYDQFTEDILLNRIFKTVVSHLIKKSTAQANRIKLGQALLWLEDVQQIKITNDVWDKVTFTRLNQQYKPVFNMARLFYNNSSLNLNKGDELTFSFLVPLNQLFEKYVYEILKKAAGRDITTRYQGPALYLGKCNGGNIFPLRPDISMSKDNKVIAIFDAKYKQLVDSEDKLLISSGDIYQMVAYSVRYDCNLIFLVYPKILGEGTKDPEIFSLDIPKEQSTLTIKAIQVELEVEHECLIQQLNSYLGNFLSNNTNRLSE